MPGPSNSSPFARLRDRRMTYGYGLAKDRIGRVLAPEVEKPKTEEEQRAERVKAAKKSGAFAPIRERYNREAAPFGRLMDDAGNIVPLSSGRNPAPAKEAPAKAATKPTAPAAPKETEETAQARATAATKAKEAKSQLDLRDDQVSVQKTRATDLAKTARARSKPLRSTYDDIKDKITKYEELEKVGKLTEYEKLEEARVRLAELEEPLKVSETLAEKLEREAEAAGASADDFKAFARDEEERIGVRRAMAEGGLDTDFAKNGYGSTMAIGQDGKLHTADPVSISASRVMKDRRRILDTLQGTDKINAMRDQDARETDPDAWESGKLESIKAMTDDDLANVVQSYPIIIDQAQKSIATLMAERQQREADRLAELNELSANNAKLIANKGFRVSSLVQEVDGTPWHEAFHKRRSSLLASEVKDQAETEAELATEQAEYERDIRVHNARISELQARQSKIDQAKQAKRDQALKELEASGMGKAAAQIAKNDAELNDRRKKIDSMYEAGSPEHKAATAALQADAEAKSKGVQEATAKTQEAAQDLYDKWGSGLSYDWSDPKSTDQVHERMVKEGKDRGLSEEETRYWLTNMAQADWSRPSVIGGKEIDPEKQDVRFLPNGGITVNPSYLLDKEGYESVVQSSNATAKAKEKAMEVRQAIAPQLASSAIKMLRGNGTMSDWLDKNTSGSDLERMEQFTAKMKKGGWTQAALMRFQAAAASIPANWLGGAAATTGDHELASAKLPSLLSANYWTKRAESYRAAAGAAEKGTNILGKYAAMVAGGIPSVAESIAAGSVGGEAYAAARLFGAAGKAVKISQKSVQAASMAGASIDAGMQSFGGTYLDAYKEYAKDELGKLAFDAEGADIKPEQIEQAKSDARNRALTPAIVSGLTTAGLTALGGARGTEAIFRKGAQEAIKKEAKSALLKFYQKAGIDIGEEALEEYSDQFVQGVIAKATYDPSMTTDQIFKEAVDAGIVGGILGGGVSAISQALDSVKPEDQASFEAQVDNFTPAPGALAPEVEKFKTMARTIAKIAAGVEPATLKADELESIGWSPAGKPGKGAAVYERDGKLVIRDQAINEVATVFPAFNDLGVKDEQERLDEIAGVRDKTEPESDAAQQGLGAEKTASASRASKISEHTPPAAVTGKDKGEQSPGPVGVAEEALMSALDKARADFEAELNAYDVAKGQTEEESKRYNDAKTRFGAAYKAYADAREARLRNEGKIPDIDEGVKNWDRNNRGRVSDEWFDGGKANAAVTEAFERAAQVGGANLSSHGMAKVGTLTKGLTDLIGLLARGVDPTKGRGSLDTAPLAVPTGSAAANAGTTAGGTSYRDGPFILVSKKPGTIKSDGDIHAVLVNDANAAQLGAIRKAIHAIRPDIIVEPYSKADQVAAQLTGKGETTSTANSSGSVDTAAHAAATSPANDLKEPTLGQINANNYKLGKPEISGIEFRVENPAGSVRKDKETGGKKWTSELKGVHYGYIAKTTGMDGDPIDVMIKEGTAEDWSGTVFVIHQIDPKTGKPDEDKVMVGFDTHAEAKAAYKRQYPKGWQGYGSYTSLAMKDLADMVKSGKLKKSPNQSNERKPRATNEPDTAGDSGIDSDNGDGESVVLPTSTGQEPTVQGGDMRDRPNASGSASEVEGAVAPSGESQQAQGGIAGASEGAGQEDGSNSGGEIRGQRAGGAQPPSWSIKTDSGKTLTIPAEEAATRAEAIGKLATLSARGDKVKPGTLQEPEVGTPTQVEEQQASQLGYSLPADAVVHDLDKESIGKVVARIAAVLESWVDDMPADLSKTASDIRAAIVAHLTPYLKSGQYQGVIIAPGEYDVAKHGAGYAVQGDRLVIYPRHFARGIMGHALASGASFSEVAEGLIELGPLHEFFHNVTQKALTDDEVADVWRSLDEKTRADFQKAYNYGRDVKMSDADLGHEFLRNRLEMIFTGKTTEEVFGKAIRGNKLYDAIVKIIEALSKLLADARNFIKGDAALKRYNEALERAMHQARTALPPEIMAMLEQRAADEGRVIAVGDIDSGAQRSNIKPDNNAIGAPQRVKNFVQANFGALLDKMGVGLVPNYAGPSAHYVISEDLGGGRKKRGGYIEYNPSRLAERSPGQIMETGREEVIHAALDKALIDLVKPDEASLASGKYHVDFYTRVHDLMTPAERELVKKAYKSHGNRPYYIGQEFARMVIQRELFGGITEQSMLGDKGSAAKSKALQVIKKLFQSMLDFMSRLAKDKTPAGRQAMAVMDDAIKILKGIEAQQKMVMAMASPDLPIQVAVKINNKVVLGKPGQTHYDIAANWIKDNELEPFVRSQPEAITYAKERLNAKWVTDHDFKEGFMADRFLSRRQAFRYLEQKGYDLSGIIEIRLDEGAESEGDARQLDSLDLPNIKPPAVRMMLAPLTPQQAGRILKGAKYIAPEDLWGADIKGPVIIGAYHGTTHPIERFTTERGVPNNNMGVGVYASTSIEDINENYAGIGPDLTSRIEQEADRLVDEHSWVDITLADVWNEMGNPEVSDKLFDAAEEKRRKAGFTDSSQDSIMAMAWKDSLSPGEYEKMRDKLAASNAISRDKALELAREKLSSHGGAVIPLYIPIKNPVVLDDDGGTVIALRSDPDSFRDEAVANVKDDKGLEDDADMEEHEDAINDEMYRLADEADQYGGPLEKIRRVVDSFDDTDSSKVIDSLIDSLIDKGYETRAVELENILRESDGTIYATDNNGDLALGDLIRQVFMDGLGFDGIIDRNVNRKFGSRTKGKPMAGMDDETVHIITDADGELRPRNGFDRNVRMMSSPALPVDPQLGLSYIGTNEGSQATRKDSSPLDSGRGIRTGSPFGGAASSASLLAWGAEKGWLIEVGSLVDLNGGAEEVPGGDEHDVWFDPKTQRAIKITIDDKFVQGSPERYIKNLRRTNELFNTGYAFEGIVDDEGQARIVTSQPWLVGQPASVPQIDAYFLDKGFKKVKDGAFYDDKDKLIVGDAMPRNVLRVGNTTQPIDAQVRPVSEREALKLEDAVQSWENQARFMAGPELDAEYMAAVQAGDMEKAQRMVDAAAKAAGYDRKLFHGTNATETVEGKSTSGSEEAIANLKALAKRIGLKDWNGITSVYQRLADNGQMGVTQEDAENAKKWQAEATGIYKPSQEKLSFDVFSPPSGELELGVHLGNESAAAMFGEVFPFFTKLGKPFRLPDLGTWNYQSVMRELRKRGVKISEAEYDTVFNANDNNAALRELLKGKGIESIVYRNEAEGEGDSFISFDPSQIKSADPVTRDADGNVIPLSRRFNTASDDIRFMSSPVTPAFYSKLSQFISSRMPTKASPKAVAAMVQAPTSGVKAEEVKWSGIVPWLEGQDGEITRQDVLDYLASEGVVRLEEVRLGERNAHMTQNARGGWDVADGDEILMRDLPFDEADQFVAEHNETGEARPTKFGQYQLPGGENYREVVLAMPKIGGLKVYDTSTGQTIKGGFETFSEAQRYIRDNALTGVNIEPIPAENYTSNHFPDVPNYVAHMRLNDRTDAEGLPGLFIEEIQSDRHQAGREKGYREEVKPSSAEEGPYSYYESRGKWLVVKEGAARSNSEYDDEESASNKAKWLNEQFLAEQRSYVVNDAGIPDAPFRTTWPLQMFKRALADAVAAGKQWIGWTTGETQAERYDLSKQVDAIDATKNLDGSYNLNAKQTNRQSWDSVASSISDNQLATYVGKDLASSILSANLAAGTTKRFEGQDLRVGGEGMKGFYDTILPKEIGKYVKQWGAGVVKGRVDAGYKEPGDDETMTSRPESIERSRYGWSLKLENGELWGAWSTTEQATKGLSLWQERFDKRDGTPIWRVDITPSMRESIQKTGQPLFMAAPAYTAANVEVGQGPEDIEPSTRYSIPQVAEAHVTDDGFIWGLETDPDKRGKGAARAILERIIDDRGDDYLGLSAKAPGSGAAQNAEPSPGGLSEAEDYRGQHTAPDSTDAPAYDLNLNGIYPQDVYQRPDWYETDDGLKEMRKILRLKGNPEAPVWIHRAIPLDTYKALMATAEASDVSFLSLTIRPGDWVTTNKQYAKDHGASALRGEFKVVSKRVKAKEIHTNGDSIFEWGYNPESSRAAGGPQALSQDALEAFYRRMGFEPEGEADANGQLMIRRPVRAMAAPEVEMTAPNGKPSNLTPKQWQTVRTPEFKAWFGDWEKFHNGKDGNGVWNDDKGEVSKIVDENGEPMLMYHGSREAGFESFDMSKAPGNRPNSAFFSNNRRVARTYSGTGRDAEIAMDDSQDDDIKSDASVRSFSNGYEVFLGEDAYRFEKDSFATIEDRDERDEKLIDAAMEKWIAEGRPGTRVDPHRGIYTVFLNIRNPLESDFEGANWDGSREGQYAVYDGDLEEIVSDETGRQYFDYESDAKQLAEKHPGAIVRVADDHHESTNAVAFEASRYKNDGAIVRNVRDDGGEFDTFEASDVVIVFNPENIKDANNNNGKFDIKDSRLLFMSAPEADPKDFNSRLLNKMVKSLESAKIPATETVESNQALVEALRQNDNNPETVRQWERKARAMLKENKQAVIDQVIDNYYNGASFGSPELAIAASMLQPEMFRDAMASGDADMMRKAQAFAYASGAGATQAGRELRALHNKNRPNKDMVRDILSTLYATVPAKKRGRIAAAPTPMEKQKKIADLQAKIRKLEAQLRAGDHDKARELIATRKAEKAAREEKDKAQLIEAYTAARRDSVVAALKAEGISEDDIFIGAEDRLAAQDSDMVREAIAKHPESQHDAIRYLMRGYSHAQVAQLTKLPVPAVAALHERFRNVTLKKSVSSWVNKGRSVLDLIREGIGRVFGVRQMAAPVPWSGVQRVVPTPTKPRKPSQPKIDISVANEIDRQLAVLMPTATQVNSGKLQATVARTKDGKEVTIHVKFSPDDFRSSYRMARAISISEASVFDKLYEYWINNLLSGIMTNVVNVLGNTASTVIHFLPQRAMEMAWNIGGAADPDSASLGEIGEIARGILPGIRQALANAWLAFDVEADPIHHMYMDEPMKIEFDFKGDIEKIGGYRGPSLGGLKGRIVRIPGRMLRAMDAAFKSIIMNMEVGAQAYRLAKVEHSKGNMVDIESFIRQQVNTPGSEAWRRAMEVAENLVFQDSNWITRVAKHYTQGLDRPVANLKQQAGELRGKGDPSAAFMKDMDATILMVFAKLMQIVFPFVKTPANILRMGLRKSPLGSIMLAMHMIHAIGRGSYNLAKGRPVFQDYPTGLLVKSLSEQTQAWTVVAALLSMSEGDDDDMDKKILFVGGRPWSEAGERDATYRDYGGTYMIIIRKDNGQEVRIPFGRYEPVATALGTTIDAMRQLKLMMRKSPQGVNREDAEIAFKAILGDFANQAEDKSFLQGFASLMREYDSIKRSGDIQGGVTETAKKSFLTALVPNLVRQTMRNLDDTVRDSKKKNADYDMLPMGKNAGPMMDLFGRDVVKDEWFPGSRLFFPVANAQQDDHPIEPLIREWNNQNLNPDERVAPTPMRRNDYYAYGAGGIKVKLETPADKTAFERRVGQEFARRTENLAKSLNGRPLPPNFKDLIDAIRADVRRDVRKSFILSPFQLAKDRLLKPTQP